MSESDVHVPQGKRVAAILCADLHLSHKPPLARAVEDDWYTAMGRSLNQLAVLASSQNPRVSPEGGHRCDVVPIVCAGDVFDRYDPPPSLINFALDHLPHLYAVPGNHELPQHRLDGLSRSAFGTLVRAGRITYLPPGEPVFVGRDVVPLRLWGFPYGCPLEPPRDYDRLAMEVAVVHTYLWVNGKGYPGASEDQQVRAHARKLRGYDVAVVGDNHTPFTVSVRGHNGASCTLFNAGCLFRRRSDERLHRPSVGLLREDGSVVRHYLDVSQDRFVEVDRVLEALSENHLGADGVFEAFTELGEVAIDFADLLRRTLDRPKVAPAVKDVLLQVLENAKAQT